MDLVISYGGTLLLVRVQLLWGQNFLVKPKMEHIDMGGYSQPLEMKITINGGSLLGTIPFI